MTANQDAILQELVLLKCQVTTEREDATRGGTLSFTTKATVTASAYEEDGETRHRARCILDISIVGHSVDDKGNEINSMEVAAEFQGDFRVSAALASTLSADEQQPDPGASLRLVNIIFPSVRHYFSCTLDLIGIAGYRLPWQLEPGEET